MAQSLVGAASIQRRADHHLQERGKQVTTTIDEIEGLLARATMDLSRPWSQVAHYELALALRAAAPDLIAVVRAAAKVAAHPRWERSEDHGLAEALARLGVKP